MNLMAIAKLGIRLGQSSTTSDSGQPMRREWEELAARAGETTRTQDTVFADAYYVGWTADRPSLRWQRRRYVAALNAAVGAQVAS